MNGYNYDEKRKENQNLINSGTNRMLASGRTTIQKSLEKKLSEFNGRLKKIPEIYSNLKNNLTNTNNKEIKRMNENIANTGNHTAGGYAISERLSNINSFNKAQRDIDLKKQNEISDIKNKMADAKTDAAEKTTQLEADIYGKNLNLNLEENNRAMEFNFEREKFMEEKRKNDSSIAKINNDIILANNEDQRETDKNERENVIHNIQVKYLPLKYAQELENMKTDNRLTEEKILTEGVTRNAKSLSGGSGKSGGSGSLKNSDQVLSKMSAKDIAESIKNQAGKKSYDSYGKVEFKLSRDKAYVYLMEWKKKYNLPDYIVNDASILLGIQDYL